MSKQQFMAGVEPVKVWAWIQALDAVATPVVDADAIPPANGSTAADRSPGRKYIVGASSSIEDPIEPWRRILERLDPLLSTPEWEDEFPVRAEALAIDIQQMVEADPDLAILAMVRLDPFDYAVAHALQTAVICDVYGQAIDMPLEQRIVMIQAALTMNIAMLELQRELEWQSFPPTPEQRKQINQHPRRGRERLEALGVDNEVWLRAVAEHHESPDGSGYPNGSQNTSAEADILAVADRYCAMLSRRGVRESMTSNRAAQSLNSLAHGRRQALVTRVIEVFGQHPPGSLVRLVNGEIAIVTRRGNAFQPEQVCALAAASGEVFVKPILRDTSQPVNVIIGSASDRDFSGTIDYVALQRAIG